MKNLLKNTLKNAPGRCGRSFVYSWRGLKAVFRGEESFRLETLAFLAMLAALAASPWPAWKRLFLIGSFLLIPLAEIVNSAIEDICDGITREPSPWVKNAKDKGALAVLAAIIANAFILFALLLA
ncbi:MAG: diacylglycerol kinase [Planctomycetota bacterium]|jgi:diacylglycerol kinase (ATP)|nr:diacylglycerol kinase [Planctomycetota bacterium]